MSRRRKKKRSRRRSHSHKGLISPQGKRYASGMAKSPRALFNMYLHGSAVTSVIKILLASIGLYGSASAGNFQAIPQYLMIVVKTVMPLFMLVGAGFVGLLGAVLTFVLNLAFGVGWSTLKYDLSTR